MVQIFFVSGAPKSGTTWLQRMLDAHPEVVCSGEGHFVEQVISPVVKMKAAWNAKLAMDAERVFEGRPYYEAITDADVAPLARNLILGVMGKRARGKAVKALGDKTPRYTHGLEALAALFPQAKFIHIVRHPYDVAVSLLHHGDRFGMERSLTLGSDQHLQLATNSANAWSQAQALVAAFDAAHPGRLVQLRYEDLQTEPEAAIAPAFRFLGVRAASGVVKAAVEAASFQALSGRRPGEEDPKSFFRKGVSGDWRGRLSGEALQAVNARCRDLMVREGYDVEA
jgi:hypothetical protein